MAGRQEERRVRELTRTILSAVVLASAVSVCLCIFAAMRCISAAGRGWRAVAAQRWFRRGADAGRNLRRGWGPAICARIGHSYDTSYAVDLLVGDDGRVIHREICHWCPRCRRYGPWVAHADRYEWKEQRGLIKPGPAYPWERWLVLRLRYGVLTLLGVGRDEMRENCWEKSSRIDDIRG